MLGGRRGGPCDGLASHPGGAEIPLVHTTETMISFSLMGHLACMQTSPFLNGKGTGHFIP